MSVTLTEKAVVERRKTVTRRLGWRILKPGDRLTLCRKVMGRKKDEPLVRLAEVEVVDVRREPISAITADDILKEGVDSSSFDAAVYDVEAGTWIPSVGTWVDWYCSEMGVTCDTEITRIEWRYVEPPG